MFILSRRLWWIGSGLLSTILTAAEAPQEISGSKQVPALEIETCQKPSRHSGLITDVNATLGTDLKNACIRSLVDGRYRRPETKAPQLRTVHATHPGVR